jgi:membrane associated rhomboid family serine protease
MRLYIFWGWFFGGLIGGVSGFYGLLMLLAKGWPNMSYEESLSCLLFGAVTGLLFGGYAAARFLARRANR